MKKNGEDAFFLNDWKVMPAQGLLSRGTETVHIEPKAMEVLVYLASYPNEVISREELEREVWRGALVGYDAITNTVIKLRKALQDNARQPHFIATIPKRGYQLVAKVSPAENSREISGELAAGSEKSFSADAPGFTGLRSYLPVLSLSVGIIAIVLWLWLPAPGSERSDDISRIEREEMLPSVIVLPFENLNNDVRQAYLANGISEDIITDLSRLSNILVFSRETAYEFEDKKVSPVQFANELGAKFVLQGSIRRLGDQVRVNAQLINTRTGFNVWAQRYDRKISEVFSVQDDVTNRIVESLAIKLTSQEKSLLSKRATDSLKAYDSFQEGRRIFALTSKETNQLAREAYRKAIELDPSYGRAYGALAVTLASDFRRGWTDSPSETLERALVMANRAVELDNSTPQTYWAQGFVYVARKEYGKAEKAALKSIKIAPNFADGYGLLGLIYVYLGQPQKSIEYNRKGMQLNPFYTYHYLYSTGTAYYIQGNYDKAVEMLEEAQRRDENAIHVKLSLAASYVKLNRQRDAQWIADQLAIMSPSTSVTSIEKTIPIIDPEVKRVYLDDLRRAGLPE